MSNLQGLCLDLDGTLADSLPFMRQVYTDFLASFGERGTEEEFARLNGPPLRQVVAMLKDWHGLPGKADDMLAFYESLVLKGYAKGARLDPGARSLLSWASATGIKTALVTSATADVTREFLEHHQLLAFFQALVCAEDVSEGKPSPAPYQQALRSLGLAPGQALAVEDSPQGIRSALSAGLMVMGKRGDSPPGLLLEAGAAAEISSLAEVMAMLGTGSLSI